MSIVSGDVSSDLLIQENRSMLSLEDILPGSYYVCRYESYWYFGVANYVDAEHSDINVKFIHPKGPGRQFFWPNNDDICWVPIEQILKQVDPPSGSTGRYYHFSNEDVIDVQNLI